MNFIPHAYEDGTDRLFRNVGIYNSDAGELPKIKHNLFRTGRKFEIKNFNFTIKIVLSVFKCREKRLRIVYRDNISFNKIFSGRQQRQVLKVLQSFRD